MKQLLEITNIVYDAANSVTTYDELNTIVHDDGKFEAKGSQKVTLPGEVKFDQIEAKAKASVEPEWDIEVVYTSNASENDIVGENQATTTGPVDANTQDAEANTNVESDKMKAEVAGLETETKQEELQG